MSENDQDIVHSTRERGSTPRTRAPHQHDPSYLPSGSPSARRAAEIVERGWTTAREVFELGFGEWPPRGVQIDAHNAEHQGILDERILIGDVWDTEKKRRGTRTAEAFERSPDSPGGNMEVHSRQIGINRHAALTKPGYYGYSQANTFLEHEVAHWLQFRQNRTALPETTHLLAGLRKREQIPEGLLDISDPIEIQARLQQALAIGYKRWGRLPETRQELYLALEDLNLSMPDDLRREVFDSPDIEQARSVFCRRELKGTANPIQDIRTVLGSLNWRQEELFWKNALPEMYGELLEMYGDPQGKERFGIHIKSPRLLLTDYEERIRDHDNSVSMLSENTVEIEHIDDRLDRFEELLKDGKRDEAERLLEQTGQKNESLARMFNYLPKDRLGHDSYSASN